MSLVTGFADFVRLIALAVWDRINAEPVITLGLVNATILLGTGFGLKWTVEQVALVGAFAAAVLSFIARKQVTPV